MIKRWTIVLALNAPCEGTQDEIVKELTVYKRPRCRDLKAWLIQYKADWLFIRKEYMHEQSYKRII
jgi:hypothetical protein